MQQYMNTGQEDFEQILQTLHEHFKLIQLTSFEELTQNNRENKNAKQLLELSNKEINQLETDLELMKIEEEDVRYDIFIMIFEMITDNINLRKRLNKLYLRLINQTELSIDKSVTKYYRSIHSRFQEIAEKQLEEQKKSDAK